MEILVKKENRRAYNRRYARAVLRNVGAMFATPLYAHTAWINWRFTKALGMTKGLRLMMFFPFIVSVFSVIFSFVVPWIQAIAIDQYIKPTGEHATALTGDRMTGFIVVIVAIVSIDLFQRALGVIQARFSAIAGNKFTLVLKTLLYEKLQSLSLASIQRRTTGDLMGRVNHDTAQMQSFITGTLPSLFIQVASFIVALVVLLIINPLICAFVFVPIPVTVFAIKKVWEVVQRRNVKAWILNTRTSYLLQDILNGIRVVKTLAWKNAKFHGSKKAALFHPVKTNRMPSCLTPYSRCLDF